MSRGRGRGQTAKYFPLAGGLDLATPALSVKAGTLFGVNNFIPGLFGGYRRADGYERVDGRPAPSASIYYVLLVADTSGFTVGLTTGVGGTSGASAIVVAIDATKDWLIITKLSGSFVATETLGGTTVTSPEIQEGADTGLEDATYTLAAEDEYRDDILTVPGSGVIRGIWRNEANLYAFRDNVGATAVDIYKATTGGWTQVVLSSHTLLFTGGGGGTGQVIAEGDTITGATSAATAVVHRLVLHAGSFAGNDASGYMVLTSVTGGPFNASENIQVSATNAGTTNGANTAVALSAGGKYKFINHNFFGGTATYSTYGCNGIDPAFELDPNGVVSPILLADLTGTPPDNEPFLIEEHRNHLFLAFANGSLQHSVPGEPLVFNGFLGAAEFGLGQDISDLQSTAGSVLVAWTKRRTFGLYGTGVADWELKILSEETGCSLDAAVVVGHTYAWDDKGITRMDRVQAFGDFISGTVSRKVQKLLSRVKSSFQNATVIRRLNIFLYTLADGEILVGYVPERGPPQYTILTFPVTPNVIYNVEDENGDEHIYFGADDGYVYEIVEGLSSYDGANIVFSLRTTYNHFGSPRMRKAFKHVGVELEAAGEVSFLLATEFSYSATDTQPSVEYTADVIGGAGFWEDAIWNQFYWSAQDIPTAHLSVTGTGVNLGMIVSGDSNLISPFTIQGFMVHYIPRRMDRG